MEDHFQYIITLRGIQVPSCQWVSFITNLKYTKQKLNTRISKKLSLWWLTIWRPKYYGHNIYLRNGDIRFRSQILFKTIRSQCFCIIIYEGQTLIVWYISKTGIYLSQKRWEIERWESVIFPPKQILGYLFTKPLKGDKFSGFQKYNSKPSGIVA